MAQARTQVAPRGSVVLKAFWLLRNRPAHVWSTARGFFLFKWAAFLRRLPFAGLKGVELGDNVRLQKSRSVMAEAPDARIRIGDDSVIYENAVISAYGKAVIEIGAGSVLGDIRIVSKCGIRIGRRFLSSWNVFIQDYDPHPVDPVLRRKQVIDMAQQMQPWMSRTRRPLPRQLSPEEWNFPGSEVVIGDDVWIGANCTILKGARIGNGCIVATGSVVGRGEYPDNHIIGGTPARVLKRIDAGAAKGGKP